MNVGVISCDTDPRFFSTKLSHQLCHFESVVGIVTTMHACGEVSSKNPLLLRKIRTVQTPTLGVFFMHGTELSTVPVNLVDTQLPAARYYGSQLHTGVENSPNLPPSPIFSP